MEDDDDVMTNGATIPSSSNINDRSATLYTPSSSNNNERSTTLYSSSSSNNNDRSATLYAPSSSHHHHNNNSYNNSNSNSSSSSKQECPICFKLFDINEIEAHSANCNFEQDDMQLDHFSHHNDSFEFNMDNNPAPDTHEESYEFNMEHQVYNVDSGDDTSECSFIDMSSSQFNEATIIPSEEEDDGYLSPLEGHVNILENPERYQQFFNQFSGSSTAKSTRGRSTTPRATTARSNRGRTSTAATKSYFARKNYYKNRGRGGRGGYGRRGRGKSV
jgi:hypothetical protein